MDLEIKYEICRHVPSVGTEGCCGMTIESRYGIGEGEAIAGRDLDEVDDIESNAYIPSRLESVG